MLIIRKQRFTAFETLLLRNFESRALQHLQKCFPEQCQTLDEPKTRELIRHGIQRARRWGISGVRDVCKFLDIMVTLAIMTSAGSG